MADDGLVGQVGEDALRRAAEVRLLPPLEGFGEPGCERPEVVGENELPEILVREDPGAIVKLLGDLLLALLEALVGRRGEQLAPLHVVDGPAGLAQRQDGQHLVRLAGVQGQADAVARRRLGEKGWHQEKGGEDREDTSATGQWGLLVALSCYGVDVALARPLVDSPRHSSSRFSDGSPGWA